MGVVPSEVGPGGCVTVNVDIDVAVAGGGLMGRRVEGVVGE
jgi:ribosomal protein S9